VVSVSDRKVFISSNESLLSAHEGLLSARESLLSAHESLLSAHEGLLSAHEGLLSAHESLLSAHESLLSARESLLSADESLLSAHEGLLSADESLLSAHEGLLSADESLLSADECLVGERILLKNKFLFINHNFKKRRIIMSTTRKPLFPSTIEAQISDLHTKLNYLVVNAPRFGIPDMQTAQLSMLVANVDAIHVKVQDKDNRTKLDTAAQKEAIREAQLDARKIITFYVAGNPAATPVDYTALNIPVPGAHPHLPAPGHVPGIGHITSSDLSVYVPFFDAQSSKRAKPVGVYGLETYYQLGGEEPTDISQMAEKAVATASPQRIAFKFTDEFQIVYLAFRWVGTRGDYGPWSDIYKINIAK
jgi:hypothetical protein